MSERTPWQTGEQSISTIAGDTGGLWPAVFDAEGNLVALVNFTDKTRLIAASPDLRDALAAVLVDAERAFNTGTQPDSVVAARALLVRLRP